MSRADRLAPNEQQVLRKEVLVARASAKPPMKDLQKDVQRALIARMRGLDTSKLTPEDKMTITSQVISAVVATNEEVAPMETKEWKFDLGQAGLRARGLPMQLRVKFHSSNPREDAVYDSLWLVGPPASTHHQFVQEDLPGDSFQEFDIPSDMVADDGSLTISYLNRNPLPVLFSMDDGIEVLYHENSFGVNFCRGLGVILCWLGFLAAIGLAAASFLSFPVAAFASLGVLTMAFFSSTIKSVVENGTVTGWDSGTASYGHSIIDTVMVPLFSGALKIINLATTFSPVDFLSSGRSITWGDLGLAFAQIIVVLGGIFAIFGIIFFTRRELAAASSQS
jgi:hypothetical protein